MCLLTVVKHTQRHEIRRRNRSRAHTSGAFGTSSPSPPLPPSVPRTFSPFRTETLSPLNSNATAPWPPAPRPLATPFYRRPRGSDGSRDLEPVEPHGVCPATGPRLVRLSAHPSTRGRGAAANVGVKYGARFKKIRMTLGAESSLSHTGPRLGPWRGVSRGETEAQWAVTWGWGVRALAFPSLRLAVLGPGDRL